MELNVRYSIRFLHVVCALTLLGLAACSSDDPAPMSVDDDSTPVAQASVTNENPPLPPTPVFGMHALGGGALAVCGDAGLAAIYQGGTWQVLPTGQSATLNRVWGTSVTDLYFAGTGGCFLHWNGTTFTTITAGTSDWVDMWADPATGEIWLVGYSIVTRWDGTAATHYSYPGDLTQSGLLRGISGTATDNVYVVSSSGVMRWNGSAWSNVVTGLPANSLNTVVAIDDEVFIGGADRELWHYDGSTWSSFTGAGTSTLGFNVIRGNATDNVFAFGYNRLMYHWDGTSWNDITDSYFHASYSFYSACVTPVGRPIVGSSASSLTSNVSRFDGSTWVPLSTSTIAVARLQDVWTFNRDNAVAVGHDGTIVERNASGWFDVTHGLTTEDLLGVWASGPNDIYAVGDEGTVLHKDGTTWSTIVPGSDTFDLYGVAGNGPSNVWIVGDEGLWHWNGSTWTNRRNELPDSLAYYAKVYVAPGGDVFLAGYDLAHYDGTSWEQVAIKSPYGADIYDMWGNSARDVWLTGYPGVFHYDGTDVALRWFTDTNDPVAITCVGANNVLAAGYRGVVQFATGIPGLVPVPVRDLEGAGTGTDGTTYFVGDLGMIIRVE